jgi:cupin 2 domain-containing protein
VIVMRGSATLEFAGGEIVQMKAGDYLEIARHVRHRVARTDSETVWLAVHVK